MISSILAQVSVSEHDIHALLSVSSCAPPAKRKRDQIRLGRVQKRENRVQNRSGRIQTERVRLHPETSALSPYDVLLRAEKSTWPLDPTSGVNIVTTDIKRDCLSQFIRATSATALEFGVCTVCQTRCSRQDLTSCPITSLKLSDLRHSDRSFTNFTSHTHRICLILDNLPTLCLSRSDELVLYLPPTGDSGRFTLMFVCMCTCVISDIHAQNIKCKPYTMIP
jgi:hypothetical protein